jgi:hypothetical protein
MLASRRGKKNRLAARGSTPGGKTRFLVSWRQKPLGGECAASCSFPGYLQDHMTIWKFYPIWRNFVGMFYAYVLKIMAWSR